MNSYIETEGVINMRRRTVRLDPKEYIKAYILESANLCKK